MTTRLVVTLAATLFVTQAPSFEGRVRLRTIHLQVEENGTQETLLDAALGVLAAREDAKVESATVMIKGNIIRTGGGADAGGVYALWDLNRNTMVLVQPKERAYMEVPLDEQPTRDPRARPAGPQPKSLGTRTINGMKATGYEIRGDDLIVRAWMTQDHPGLTWAFRQAISQKDYEGEEDPEDAATAQLARYGFPVVLYTLNRGSLEIEETVGIERAALGPETFKVPAGFTKKSLGENP